jgi:hypothetical protein
MWRVEINGEQRRSGEKRQCGGRWGSRSGPARAGGRGVLGTATRREGGPAVARRCCSGALVDEVGQQHVGELHRALRVLRGLFEQRKQW